MILDCTHTIPRGHEACYSCMKKDRDRLKLELKDYRDLDDKAKESGLSGAIMGLFEDRDRLEREKELLTLRCHQLDPDCSGHFLDCPNCSQALEE